MEVGVPEMVFNTNRKILEELIIIKKIYAKLIFSKYIILDWDNYYKFEAICNTNYKNNTIKVEKKDLKTGAKQFKNNKQQ